MQINGISSGPTMAASEPPEPPPRNPERINASLHKLNEAKAIKSLDIASTPNDKIVNNNKPLKPLLSLDNSATNSASTPNNIFKTPTIGSKAVNVLSGTAATTSSAISTSASSIISNSNLKRNESTPIGVFSGNIGCDNNSPNSSNGSNQTLTSPMTIDNQRQQFLNKSESHVQLMQQHQQNGIATSAISMAASTGVAMQLTNGSLGNANNSIPANHLQAQNTSVDERNANDICSILNTKNFNSSKSSVSLSSPTTMQSYLQQQPSRNLSSPSSSSRKSLINCGKIINCDDNRNDSSSQTQLALQLQASLVATATPSTTTSTSTKTSTLTSAILESNATNFSNQPDSPSKLRDENERLNAEVARLRKLLENSSEGAVGGIDLSDSNSCGDTQSTDTNNGSAQQKVDRLESELRSANAQLMSLRIERKKLRLDKNELMSQVKQLCASLQDKEQELRDFIRNYNERVRETESNTAKLTGDRERERWQLLKQARDEAERSLSLAQQLSARDMQLQRLQEQLQDARRQLSGCLSDQESLLSYAPLTPPSATAGMMNQISNNTNRDSGVVLRTDDSGRGNSLSGFSGSSGATAGDRNSCSNDSVLRNNSDRESTGGDMNFSDGTCDNGPCITVDPDSISIVSSQNMYQYGTPKERSPTLSPLNSAAYSRSVEQLGSPVDSEGPGALSRKFPTKSGQTLTARTGRGGTWGSISRVFARSRNKSKALSADGGTDFLDYSWSPLSEEGYAEKLRLLREAAQIPMERWRASQVIAWLEVALGMPQYSTRCAENIKSGKVLLELSDAELETGLGLGHPMHRKKLRLAIEEQRRPELVRYPMITQLGHTWVASEWLPDIGLPQYAEPFLHSLVDARMLDTLSKKELEKFLGVTRKFHQAAIVHGIHVLRIVKYDRQTLAMRRVQSETIDTDPIVWTNQRFIRWAKSIDLGEYADNLKDSGVHGGLVVLEPSFSGDTMATALGIPPSKNIIRRHLATEFDALILPARSTLGQGIRSGCGIVPITGPGGLQHYATTDRRSSGSLRISAWKGSQSSLSKTFRFNTKSSRAGDRNSFGNSTSPTPSYSSSEGGGGIYATIGTTGHHHFLPPPTTAPPPPPIYATHQRHQQQQQQQHYSQYGVPPAHRISAPPPTVSISDPNLLQEQHRRVKSINDIGMAASGRINLNGGGGSMDSTSGNSNSPV